MTILHARHALLPDGWAQNVEVAIAPDGCIGSVTSGANASSSRDGQQVEILLPAMANLHSHSFQRAMAGRTEIRLAGRDSFWTWRDLMYRFTANLTPDQIEAIANLVFMEMLEAGYASVGEFHYLHHQPDGTPYDDLTETSNRIFAAANHTGIGLTHLPVLYAFGGVGEKPLNSAQARFGNNLDRYVRLVKDAGAAIVKSLPADARVGIAPHSLRAIAPAMLGALTEKFPDCPVHIHIAEQPLEVEEISAWLGARPVRWLLDNAAVNARWCVVHATHMDDMETRDLAKSGAVAGLCPITEANLGDGPFNGPAFLEAGGIFGIGSDSNVRISLSEELRLLEYSQRLDQISRNVLVVSEGSVGMSLYQRALSGGAQALGRKSDAIAEGRLADLVALDADAIAFTGLAPEQYLDGWLFGGDDRLVRDVWSAGRHMVKDGEHVKRSAITGKYRAAISNLLAQV